MVVEKVVGKTGRTWQSGITSVSEEERKTRGKGLGSSSAGGRKERFRGACEGNEGGLRGETRGIGRGLWGLRRAEHLTRLGKKVTVEKGHEYDASRVIIVGVLDGMKFPGWLEDCLLTTWG
jgi:hypothetical protein